MKSIFNFIRKNDAKKVVRSMDDQAISRAYKNVASEIESLRQYDRGEKEIHAPDLRAAVQGLRKTL